MLHYTHRAHLCGLFAHTQELTFYPGFHDNSHCKFRGNFSISAVLPPTLQTQFCHRRTIPIITLLDTEVKGSKLSPFLVLASSVNLSLQIVYKFFTLVADTVA